MQQRLETLIVLVSAWLIFLMTSATGCGDSRSGLAEVRGVVTLNGEPLASGQVLTMHEQGRGASGQIGADGTFELSTYEPGDGAMLGLHRVMVSAHENPPSSDPEAPLGKLLVPKRYTNVESSGLTIDVTDDGNHPVLELTSP